jgi:hypothetical protein
MSFYDRDPSVPFWRANVDVDSLFAAHKHRAGRAQAWLKFREVSECSILEQAVMMRGHFELGILSDHTYHWTFTPTHAGDLAVVLPVYERGRLVDLLAIARNDHTVWGCVTGAGQYAGRTDMPRRDSTEPIRLYKTPINWLLANCKGLLPLAKAFFPQLQHAPGIVGDNIEHAWEIAEYVFTGPAQRHYLDFNAAERAALAKVGFEVET